MQVVSGDRNETWRELQSLEMETDSLLRGIKKGNYKTKNSPSASGSQGVTKKSDKLKKISTTGRRRKNLKENSETTTIQYSFTNKVDSLEKTRNVFGTERLSGARITVEVLDDASPDSTPRQDYDLRKKSVLDFSPTEIGTVLDDEDRFGKMAFKTEKARVLAKDDVFVPAPSVTISDVDNERQRLVRLEESSRMKRNKLQSEIESRKHYLAQDKAALKLQALFRGHIGRHKYTLTRRLREMMDDRTGNWVEVRDKDTGDIWYYNTKSGISQWERPRELQNSLAAEGNLKSIPPLHKQNTSSKLTAASVTLPSLGSPPAKTSKLSQTRKQEKSLTFASQKNYQSSSSSSMIQTQTQEQVYEDKMKKKEVEHEIREQLGVEDWMPADSFIGPDGAFKPQLRATILNTLVDHRFNSLSSVLADERFAKTASRSTRTRMMSKSATFSGDANNTTTSSSGGFESSTTDKMGTFRKPMISVLTFNRRKSQKLLARINVDSSKDLPPASFRPGSAPEMTAITNISSLTVRDVSHPGFEAPDTAGESPPLMCFGCWSSGSRSCNLHQSESRLKPSQTMLLCRNWELSVMRRRYRSEEIQEVFMKKAASLKYDVSRKRFMTVAENRHPIYRLLFNVLDRFNFRSLLHTRVKRWLSSFTEIIRQGRVKPFRTAEKARKIRLRRSLKFAASVMTYTLEVRPQLPVPPITGYTWPERTGSIQYLYSHRDHYLEEDVEIILSYPVPRPIALYLPRQYHLPVPTSIPMPTPEYNLEGGRGKVLPANNYLPENSPCAWLERLSSSVVRDSIRQASEQITTITPLPRVALLHHVKYLAPTTVKFATLGRKPTPSMMAVGGLPVELLVSQLITTFVPAQFGNLMVMDKVTLSPGVSPEITVTFESLRMGPVTQPYKPRPVDHPLNSRRAPTVTINSLIDAEDRFFYGTNRPEQTGEQESHGFRTTAWARHLLCHIETDPHTFTPGAEVAALNATSSNLSVTTHADSTYPFCDPSTRDNTTLDFYHLLLTGKVSLPTSQVFTALTVQEPGEFLKSGRADLPMGHVVVAVYRSWAFTQRDAIEEFTSDDGLKYWYHRRTGVTYWERPLYKEEEVSPLEGGTLLDMAHPEEPMTTHCGVEGQSRRYLQGEFRKQMLNHHETLEEAKVRRRNAGNSAVLARQNGILPQIDVASIPATPASEPEPIMEGKPVVVELTTSSGSLDRKGGSLGTHYSAESSLQNDQGVKRSLRSPMRQLEMTGRLEGLGEVSEEEEEEGEEPFRINTTFSQSQSRREIRPSTSNENEGVRQTGGVQDTKLVQQISGAAAPPSSVFSQEVISNLSQTLGQIFSTINTQNVSPQDMMQLGLGMGIALLQSQSQNMTASPATPATTAILPTTAPAASNTFPRRAISNSNNNNSNTMSPFTPTLTPARRVSMCDQLGSSEGEGSPLEVGEGAFSSSFHSHFDSSVESSMYVPIGAVNPTVRKNENVVLDHSEESVLRNRVRAQGQVPLSAKEIASELKVVPSDTPDNCFSATSGFELEPPINAEEEARRTVPLVVYPEIYTTCQVEGGVPADYRTHPAAGLGTSFVLEKDKDSHEFVPGTKLRRTVVPLPIGFFAAIKAKHVAKQNVDYLPQIPNLPQTRNVGRVKPRSAAVDWLAISFDPWSAGKSPLNKEFVSSLQSKVEQMYGAARARDEMESMKLSPDDVVELNDLDGRADQQVELSKMQQIAEDFKKMASLARNGKFIEVEDMMSQPDWAVPIDYQDDLGNCLLHIASQNGNRRIVKLCLKRGADVNIQNVNGQTPLHFALAYGYEKLGEYLIRKGADNSIRNKDGLTCYEGLSSLEISLL